MTPYSPRSRGDTTAAADQRILMARLVRHLTDRATELGIDTGAALKAAGLGTANWDDPRHTVAVRQLEALLDHLLHTSGEQQLGLRLAEAATPEAFGVVGYIRQACGTFGEFIEMCMRYEHLISSIGKTSLLHQPGRVLLCWEVVTEHPAFRRHATEYMLAALASTRQLLPPEQRQCLLAVHFHHGPPATGADLDMYRQLFQCPIRFDQPQSALVLPREALQYRFSSADVALLQALERHALHLADNEPTSNLVERARLSLHTLVLEGRASREALADTLGISSRHLHRHLAARGENYRTLLNRVQLEVAIELLMEPGLRVEDAGRRLGYSESQSFIRWFRRQTGDTPSRYRSRHRLT